MAFRVRKVFGSFQKRTPGTRFSKVPKLFGRILGDIILFVSSKRRRLEARNFAVIFILQHMKRPALHNKQIVVLRMAFRARKVLGTFRETGSRAEVLGTRLKGAELAAFYRTCMERVDDEIKCCVSCLRRSALGSISTLIRIFLCPCVSPFL